jgi:hypothetical protein
MHRGQEVHGQLCPAAVAYDFAGASDSERSISRKQDLAFTGVIAANTVVDADHRAAARHGNPQHHWGSGIAESGGVGGPDCCRGVAAILNLGLDDGAGVQGLNGVTQELMRGA